MESESVPQPEITYQENFWPDHANLYEAVLKDVSWRTAMHSRHTASMGVPYNYAGATYPEIDFHPGVAAVARKVSETVGFKVTNCILNCYMTGENTVNWHADDVTILEPGTPIAIVSLGCQRALSLRTSFNGKFHYVDQQLAPGSLLTMSSAMQADWKHAIRRDTSTSPRISLTFRHITHVPPPPVDMGRWGSPARKALAEIEAAEADARLVVAADESCAFSAIAAEHAAFVGRETPTAQ